MSYNLFDKLRQRENNIGHQNVNVFEKRLYRDRINAARNLYHLDLKGHYASVNDLKFSESGNLMVSGGYDKRLLVWDIEKCITGSANPCIMIQNHQTSLLCLALDKSNDLITTCTRNGALYIYDLHTNQLMWQMRHVCRILSISIDPQTSKQFALANADGCVFIYDIRCQPKHFLLIQSDSASFQSIEYHPLNSHLLITGHLYEGVALYDLRRVNQCIRKYKAMENKPKTCNSVQFNRTGDMILASGKKLPLILYGVNSPEIVCSFYDNNYLTAFTKKSGTFFGENDEFIAAGSDDFNVYIWRVADINLNNTNQHAHKAHLILHGHRSIVNTVRYNRPKGLLASCGAEKLVKLWSPFNHKNWRGNLAEITSHPRHLQPISPHNLTLDYVSHLLTRTCIQSTDEDPSIIAFFDFLLYKEYVIGQSSNSLMHYV